MASTKIAATEDYSSSLAEDGHGVMHRVIDAPSEVSGCMHGLALVVALVASAKVDEAKTPGSLEEYQIEETGAPSLRAAGVWC